MTERRGAFHRLDQADPDGPTVLFVSAPIGVGGSTRSMAYLLTYMDGHVRRVLAGPPEGSFHDLVTGTPAMAAYLDDGVDSIVVPPARQRAAAGRTRNRGG